MTDLEALGLPEGKQHTLRRAVAALTPVAGVQAIVLGGSYARGTYRSDSDLDLGLYYRDASPFAVEDIRRIANLLASRDGAVVTDLYEWGPWVNGGAWIPTPVCRVDLLYRSIEDVERTISDAERGEWKHHFDQQPPFGFRSVIYLAEIASCVALVDPSGTIAALKRRVVRFPQALQRTIVGQMLWGCEFALFNANDFAARGDVVATAGTLARVAHYLTQALFAINETYFIGDKAAPRDIEGFAKKPAAIWDELGAILACPGGTAPELVASVARATALTQAVISLTQGAYRPRFQLVAK